MGKEDKIVLLPLFPHGLAHGVHVPASRKSIFSQSASLNIYSDNVDIVSANQGEMIEKLTKRGIRIK
jgi:hypothetical protein